MENSRTKNTIKNFSSSLLVQLLNKVMTFIVRTVFIHILNSEYLGINGLFTNILSLLSFAEFGIGVAIVYNMYKPIVDDDVEKIKSLMKLYKKAYHTIGIVVFLAGLCVIPFFDFIIKETPNVKENIVFIYFLYLLNTSVSYFFVYKKSIISAYQQERIVNRISAYFSIIRHTLEIVFLVATKNFIAYLIIQIVCTITENIVVSNKANKMFPYLKSKTAMPLQKEEKKGIFNNVKSLVVYKVGTVVLSGTDNIIMSAIINVATVGICSNYVLIVESIRGLLVSAFDGITASIGNLNVQSETRKKENVFYQLTLICFWVYGFCAIAFIVLLDPFIKIWLGDAYVLPYAVSISLALNFFVIGFRNSAYMYRITMGLFEKGKYAPFFAAIINIILSIILGKLIGVAGIFFATSISQIFTYCWIDPVLIYRHEFKTSIKPYCTRVLKYMLVFALACFITVLITNSMSGIGIINLILKMGITVIVPNIIFYIFLFNTKEFNSIKSKVLSFIKGRKHSYEKC